MKGNWLTIFPIVAGLGLAGQTGEGEGLEGGGEGPGGRAPGKGLLQRLGEKWLRCCLRQPGDVRSRRAIRFSFCPSDEHRGDS